MGQVGVKRVYRSFHESYCIEFIMKWLRFRSKPLTDKRARKKGGHNDTISSSPDNCYDDYYVSKGVRISATGKSFNSHATVISLSLSSVTRSDFSPCSFTSGRVDAASSSALIFFAGR